MLDKKQQINNPFCFKLQTIQHFKIVKKAKHDTKNIDIFQNQTLSNFEHLKFPPPKKKQTKNQTFSKFQNFKHKSKSQNSKHSKFRN